MTDRFKSLTVVLDEDLRQDDARGLIAAIERMRGVLAVSGNVRDPNDFANRVRIRTELEERLWAALRKEPE